MKPGPELRALRQTPNRVREAVTAKPAFDVGAMRRWVDADQHELRAELREFLKDELFVGRYNLTLAAERSLATRRLKKLCERPGRFVSIRDFETDPRRVFAVHELTCMVDGSFATKGASVARRGWCRLAAAPATDVRSTVTVNFNLAGGTILKLGTERHHFVLDKMDRAEEIGCFCLTELGFGNNAVKLATRADFDERTKEFVIDTPEPLAQKCASAERFVVAVARRRRAFSFSRD